MIVVIIIVLIALALGIWIVITKFKNKLRHVQLSAPTSNPVQQADNYKFKLLHYSSNIAVPGNSFGLFQKGRNFWLVDSANVSQTGIVNLRDIYPAFKGRPKGMIVIPGTQYNNNAFIIFSSDGKVYNPFTISHSWRKDFLYLPNDDPISIDGRPLPIGIVNGLFSGNGNKGLSAEEGAILFRFYYPGYYIEESGCVNSGTDSNEHPNCIDGTCNPIKSCNQRKVEIPHSPFAVTSYYQYAGTLYSISSDGKIYSLQSDNSWKVDSNWTTTFAGLSIPESTPLNNSDTTKMYLMGADYDDGVPVFMIYENGIRYIVDRSARKYDFSKTFRDENILPVGNPLDFTKAGPGEFDYLVLYSDGKVYGPSLPATNGHSRKVKDFESVYPALNCSSPNCNCISITSVNKWQNNTDNPGKSTFKYYLVFLYDNGQWFEAQYDISSDTILGLGQSDQISGKWNQWPHVQNALSKLNSNQTYKISSFGWSIFVFDTTYNFSNDMVYSINHPPESWIDMLLCNSKDDGNGKDIFKSSTCVGVGEWKDYIFSTGDYPPMMYNGFNVYEDYGLDTDNNPGTVIRKISLDQCLSNNSSANAIVYDQAESDCHVYNTLLLLNTVRDSSKSTFIAPEYDATFQNRFCIKHKPSNKYLYWDFVNPDGQFLGLMDSCSYQGDPNIGTNPSPATGDVEALQRSLGAIWALDGPSNSLRNLNGAAGGFLIANTQQMALTGDGAFTYINNNFTDNKGNCFYSDGVNFSEGTKCNGDWLIESVPCPSIASTGYISEFCQR